MPVLLQVEDLRTQFATSVGTARAVDCLSHTVDEGETVGIVGGSGCGKSVGALSILRLIPDSPGSSATIRFAERRLQPTVPTLSERRRAPMRADCARTGAHFYYLVGDEAVPARPDGGRQLATGSAAADGIEARVLGRLSTRVESVGTGFMGA